jgi:hypothetical protein
MVKIRAPDGIQSAGWPVAYDKCVATGTICMDMSTKRLSELSDDTSPPHNVLEAINHLLDAIEGFDAPITRELLGTAMMALVHECGLALDRAELN